MKESKESLNAYKLREKYSELRLDCEEDFKWIEDLKVIYKGPDGLTETIEDNNRLQDIASKYSSFAKSVRSITEPIQPWTSICDHATKAPVDQKNVSQENLLDKYWLSTAFTDRQVDAASSVFIKCPYKSSSEWDAAWSTTAGKLYVSKLESQKFAEEGRIEAQYKALSEELATWQEEIVSVDIHNLIEEWLQSNGLKKAEEVLDLMRDIGSKVVFFFEEFSSLIKCEVRLALIERCLSKIIKVVTRFSYDYREGYRRQHRFPIKNLDDYHSLALIIPAANR